MGEIFDELCNLNDEKWEHTLYFYKKIKHLKDQEFHTCIRPVESNVSCLNVITMWHSWHWKCIPLKKRLVMWTCNDLFLVSPNKLFSKLSGASNLRCLNTPVISLWLYFNPHSELTYEAPNDLISLSIMNNMISYHNANKKITIEHAA